MNEKERSCMQMDGYGKVSGVSRVPLAEQVYQNLVDSIASGDLPAGTELREQHLAKQMNVSATPVREALRRLASDGLVEMVPYHGAVVRTLNQKEIQEAYSCREALERLAIREAISRITEEDISYLYELIEEFSHAAGVLEVSEASQKFDEYIYGLSDNETLCRLLGMLKGVISRDRKYSSSNVARQKEIVMEHRAIVDAMRDRDVEQAQKAISSHIQNGRKYIEKK